MVDGASLGLYLKQLRLQSGYSRAKAAKLARLSATRLYELEIGVSSTTRRPTSPSSEQLQRLARTYGVDSEELLERAGYLIKTRELPPEIERLIELYRRLPIRTRSMIVELIELLSNYQIN
jgi:transcriptional regulator with XRE-family HTH domain